MGNLGTKRPALQAQVCLQFEGLPSSLGLFPMKFEVLFKLHFSDRYLFPKEI